MFRPNPIGLSVVELKSVRQQDKTIFLDITGGDFLDATPVLDIKPYLPYVDSVPQASGGYAHQAPESQFKIIFSQQVLEQMKSCILQYPELQHIISGILQYDPRPAYRSKDASSSEEYAMKLYEFDVKWRISNDQILVYSLN
ncbi:MAG TPA: TrmO family methyltransferase, partial [Gammaproteobacteria bacterium]